MTGPDQDRSTGGSTPWQRGQNLSQQGGQDVTADQRMADASGADDPTTVVSREELAGAAPQPRPDGVRQEAEGYPTSQDYRAPGPEAAAAEAGEPEVHGYPVTRDPEIAEAARRADTSADRDQADTAAGDTAVRDTPVRDTPVRDAVRDERVAVADEQPPTQWHDGQADDATRQFASAPARDGQLGNTTTGSPYAERPGYQATPAYSATQDRAQPGQVGPGDPSVSGPNYGADPNRPATYGSASTGFFSPQEVQTGRVELAPAKTRIGHNLLGALVGLILVAGAAALYAVVFKNATGTDATGTGHKLALIGIALVLAIPALIAGWAPAAAWFPGIILVLGVGVAMFSDSLATTYNDWSNSLFGTPAAAQVLLNWGMVAGFALLLAGIGAHLGRRGAEHGVVDRIVSR